MTQSPYGGTASQRLQSTPGTGTTSADTNNGSNSDFGATTISGAPKQGSQQGTQPSTQQHNGPLVQGTAAPAQHGQRQPNPSQSGPQTAQHSAGRTSGSPASGRGIRNRGPRRARLQLRHISPLTVLKFSCVLAIALFFVWLILVGVLYGVLDAAGAIQSVNDTVVQLNGAGSKPPITAGIVFGGAAIIGVINIVLFVALMTIGSVIYNLCADLVGGIEITLSER